MLHQNRRYSGVISKGFGGLYSTFFAIPGIAFLADFAKWWCLMDFHLLFPRAVVGNFL